MWTLGVVADMVCVVWWFLKVSRRDSPENELCDPNGDPDIVLGNFDPSEASKFDGA